MEKMHELGWTAPGYFDNPADEIVLKHCIARYHGWVFPDSLVNGRCLMYVRRFLDLMANSPSSFFVPTLDIDLAWHTHQLMGPKYNEQCMVTIVRYIDQ